MTVASAGACRPSLGSADHGHVACRIDWNSVGKRAIWSSTNVQGLPGVASQELGYAAQRLAPGVFALVALHRQWPISEKAAVSWLPLR